MKSLLLASLVLSLSIALSGCGSSTPDVKQDPGAGTKVVSPTDPMVQKIRAAKLAAKKNAD